MHARSLAPLAISAAIATPNLALGGEMQTTFVDRIVGASTFVQACNPEQQSQSVLNQTFDPFSVTVGFSEECGAASGSSESRHDSTIGPMSIHAVSQAAVHGQTQLFASLSLGAFSFFQTDFTLDASTPYVLTGTLNGQAISATHFASVALVGAQGTIVEFELASQTNDPPTLSFNHLGELAPGPYRVLAFTSTNLSGEPPHPQSATAGVEVLFAMTDCLCDLDGSRDVGLQDLAVLLANFGVPDAAFDDGDFDADGDVDVSDLARLLACFGAVCE